MLDHPATALPQLDDRYFQDLSVYQDVVLAGQTVRRGARDCEARWELIAPHLPRSGSVLDVGSNFGWFGLRICQAHPDCVVASVEADQRSAAVQREVLRSHGHERICLLTGRAGNRMIRRFARAGQRFDAALCLSVLHWLPDHRRFLTCLGEITAVLFVEHPHPSESGAGVERIRHEIGAIGPYLRACFPNRPVRCLGTTANHRRPDLPREMWLVGGTEAEAVTSSPGLNVAALMRGSVSWPPRSWWQDQIQGLQVLCDQDEIADEQPAATTESPGASARQVLLTSRGLRLSGVGGKPLSFGRLRRRIQAIPEDRLFSAGELRRRRLRRTAGMVFRSLRCAGELAYWISHMRMARSKPTETSCLPSGLKATP